jgi:hypothetical protein
MHTDFVAIQMRHRLLDCLGRGAVAAAGIGHQDQYFLSHRSFVIRPLSLISALKNRLGTFGKLAAWHQYLATAGEAANPDVCAQPDHAPLVAAARMWLAHSNYIVKPNVGGVNHQ